jgi:hypothetical protein
MLQLALQQPNQAAPDDLPLPQRDRILRLDVLSRACYRQH